MNRPRTRSEELRAFQPLMRQENFQTFCVPVIANHGQEMIAIQRQRLHVAMQVIDAFLNSKRTLRKNNIHSYSGKVLYVTKITE